MMFERRWCCEGNPQGEEFFKLNYGFEEYIVSKIS